MSETEEGLQQVLLNFEQYCDLWKLKVNNNPILHTVSKALLKSIHEQNNFFPKEKLIDISVVVFRTVLTVVGFFLTVLTMW
jgi:uncharacterized protein YggT (Ycf19 family)